MPDVVVVGAGIMGASISLELQRIGRSVLVVDRGGAVGAGSTSASSAVVRFNYSTLAGVTAAWESAHRWADWVGHLGHTSGADPLARFVTCPMLFFEPPGFPRAEATALLSAVGVPWEVLDETGLKQRFPAIDPGRYHPPRRPDDPRFDIGPFGRIDALLTPDSGFIDDPQLAAVNLMNAARHLGTEVRLRSEVVEVRRSGTNPDRTIGITLADGTQIDTTVVVNAAGPWSSGLNHLAGVFTGATDGVVANRPMRQEVHVVPAPEQFVLDGGGAMMSDLDLGYYARPQPGGTLLVGGVEPECDPLEWLDDPDATPANPTVECFEAQVWRLARRLPGLAIPHRPSGLAGVYDVTPDWVPIYDRTSLDGFYVAIGTSGNQFKNAPLVGQIMCEIIEACESGHDHDAQAVTTWCNRIDRPLDLAAFSRLRALTPTTGTVMG
ncbi:MAG: FAD-dependent oxidoreductase [Acidimicrobiales bacterium]|nr:FAD-dependent oxidoreductase [Acidimicrobiales bacterium]